jgi:tetratricopeptide (TPR) repeat protein
LAQPCAGTGSRRAELSEGAEWYAHILALPCPEPESRARAQVLAAAALIAGRQGKTTDAVRLHEQAIALWRLLGDDLELATSLSNLGYVYRHNGQLAEARRCFNEGIQLSEGRLPQAEALNRIGLAESLYDLEQYEHALSHAARALELQEGLAIGGVGRAWTKRAIGLIHYQLGSQSLARQFLEESLDEARKEERRGWWLADALASVAQLDVDCSRFDRAHALLSEGLQLSNTLGDRRSFVRCLERLAYLAVAERQSIRALHLAAAADALRTQADLPRSPVENRLLNQWLATTERALNPTDLQRVRREAAMMQVEEVLGYALAGAHAAEAVAHSQGHDGLTRREREVVVL